jgi:acyl carrier protein
MKIAERKSGVTMNQVAEECIALIAKQKSIPPEQIRLDSTFDELAVDSFDIEEKFEIEIPEQKLGQIKTVNDMVIGIEEAVRQKTAAPKPNK